MQGSNWSKACFACNQFEFTSLIPLYPTVVKHPDFYYHLTTIDGIDLPHFAVFCFFRDLSHRLFTTFSARQIAAKWGRIRLFRRLIAFDKDTFCVPRQASNKKPIFPVKSSTFDHPSRSLHPVCTLRTRKKLGKEGSSCHWNCKYVRIISDSIWAKPQCLEKPVFFLFLQRPTVSFTPFVSTHQARHDIL